MTRDRLTPQSACTQAMQLRPRDDLGGVRGLPLRGSARRAFSVLHSLPPTPPKLVCSLFGGVRVSSAKTTP